jgi:hypothetical protein
LETTLSDALLVVLVFLTSFGAFGATLPFTSLAPGFLTVDRADARATGFAGFLAGFFTATLVGRDGLRAVGLLGRAVLAALARACVAGFLAARAGFLAFLTIFRDSSGGSKLSLVRRRSFSDRFSAARRNLSLYQPD